MFFHARQALTSHYATSKFTLTTIIVYMYAQQCSYKLSITSGAGFAIMNNNKVRNNQLLVCH